MSTVLFPWSHKKWQFGCRTERAWQALGKVRYGPTEAERKSLVFRRSIYVAQDINEGDLFTKETFASFGLATVPHRISNNYWTRPGDPMAQEHH